MAFSIRFPFGPGGPSREMRFSSRVREAGERLSARDSRIDPCAEAEVPIFERQHPAKTEAVELFRDIAGVHVEHACEPRGGE